MMLEHTPDGHRTQVDPMVVSPFYHYVTLFPYWNNVLPSNRQGVKQCHRAHDVQGSLDWTNIVRTQKA